MQMDFEISRLKNLGSQCRFFTPPPPFFFLRRWFSICISLFQIQYQRKEIQLFWKKTPSYINNKTHSYKTLQQEL